MTSLSPVRPVERVTPILTLLLVFLSGAGAGGVVMSMVGHRIHGGNSPVVSASNMAMSVGEWKHKLDLSDDQERQLKSVLDDFSKYYDDLLSDGNTRILQILNDTQKKKFTQMMQERKPK